MKKVLIASLFLSIAFLGCKTQKQIVTTNMELAIIPQPKFVAIAQKKLNVKALHELELPSDWNDLGAQFVDFNQKNNLGSL